ncbi:MAG: undecaprenyl-diphosphate phosphatase [Nannocystaceae bacterium]
MSALASSLEQPASVIDPWIAACLGALQGVAEFLPISSSGHLSLAQVLLGIDSAQGGLRFSIVVHSGTLLAVCWVYRGDIWRLLRAVFHVEDREGRAMIGSLLVGSLPLVVVLLPGVEGLVVSAAGNLTAIGSAFLATAALLAYCQRRDCGSRVEAFAAPAWRQALWIGFAQLVAVAPGVSRSGATIACGLALGLGRAQAARFSFLLSLPAIGAATLREAAAIASADELRAVEAEPYAVGFVVSLVVGLLSLRVLLKILERFGLFPFVPYLVVVGIAAIALR